MFPTAPARHAWRVASLLTATLIVACSDASAPDARPMPTTPFAQVGQALIVTNTNDSGPGSLRQTIIDAVDGDVIHFDPDIAGQTIVLGKHLTIAGKNLTIEGPITGGMTLDGSLNDNVAIISASVLLLRNLSIVNGIQFGVGGGVFVINSDVTLDHVTVANNEGTKGGGIGMIGPTSQLTLLNSTVTGNTADLGGGVYTDSGTVVTRNSTITQNISAGPGGGILAGEVTVSFRNSIVANNSNLSNANTNQNCSVKGTLVASGTNLSNDASCGLSFSVGDPRLGPLADHGGPTHTQALLFGSPAIDLGTSCTEATDQRYVTRPQGTSCDVGAFEFDSFRNINLTISPNVAVNAKTGVATVTGTISCPGQAYSPLRVMLSQTQKTTGKFTTIIQGQADIPGATCTSAPASWSVALTPATGKFGPGAATGSATVTSAPGGYVPASVASTLKLFQVK